MTPAFVILLTFMGVGPHPNLAFRTIQCPDLACVHNVIDHAQESRLLSRLRVFPEDEANYAGQIGMQPAYLPLIDLQFN